MKTTWDTPKNKIERNVIFYAHGSFINITPKGFIMCSGFMRR